MPQGIKQTRDKPAEREDVEQKDIDETHPGFTVICDKCKSKKVYVESSCGASAESGAWGSVDLVCNDCGNRIEVYNN